MITHSSPDYYILSDALGDRFFANSSLIIKLKGIVMKLKSFACAISKEQHIFFNVVQRPYKPLNFDRAILPYAAG